MTRGLVAGRQGLGWQPGKTGKGRHGLRGRKVGKARHESDDSRRGSTPRAPRSNKELRIKN